MSVLYEKLETCYEYYRSVTDFVPKVGLILGSGLGGYAENMKVEKEIPYSDIPGFPISTVQGHDGRFLLGYIGDVPAVVMKGRGHYYEGYSIKEISKLLQIPLPTVGTRLSRGRERLRQLLKEDVE